MPTFEAKGVPLYYEENGSGNPVVFVHGTLNDYAAWHYQTEALSKEFRTITYSRRYAYPNNRQGDVMDSTVQNNAEDLGALIDGLGGGKVHLVGHSYGGFVSAYFALNHPEKLRSLILANAAVATMLVRRNSTAANLALLLRAPSVATSARKFLNATATTLKAMSSGDSTAVHDVFVPALLNGRTDLPAKPELFEEIVSRNARTLREVTTRYPEVTRVEATRIRIPTLVLWGGLSAPWDYRISEMLAESIPACEKAVIPGTSHFFFVEKPTEANDLMLRFLRKHTVQ